MEDSINEIKFVAIYLRRSRDEGIDSKEVLTNHERILTRYVAEKAWKYEIHREIGSAATIKGRPIFSKLLENLDNYDAMVCIDQDRLSRDIADTIQIKQQFILTNTFFVTPDRGVIDFTKDELVSNLLAVLADSEYKKIKERLRRGQVENTRRGFWIGGTAPIGYKYDSKKKKLAVDEEKAHIVRYVFDEYIKCGSLRNVAVNLNKRGYRTATGELFYQRSIDRMIKNVCYIGVIKRTFDNETIIIKDAHEPLISESIFNKAQEIMGAMSTRGTAARARKYSLSGLVRCGQCGYSVNIQKRVSKKRTRVIMRNCLHYNYLNERMCHNRSYPLPEFEEAVFSSLIAKRDDIRKRIEQLESNEGEVKKRERDVQKQIKTLSRKNENLIKRADKLTDMYLDDDLFSREEYVRRKRDYEEQIKSTKEQIEVLRNSSNTDVEIKSSRSLLEAFDELLQPHFFDLPDEDRNLFYSRVIERINYTYEKGADQPIIEIVYR
ncbi:recombinase family protein [Baia soyae]|uniref:DNA invertase Pin-like site-specific DNA recombinase n=1 Tax=Baia soyae TaxID=1544746 RepID=A0A4R2S7A7_9BACL|nr:recombinase family protein [Baia soyae]TCP68271.1 DNA invertase Pin-like site-specific DNA recombinase [Baia soyae]